VIVGLVQFGLGKNFTLMPSLQSVAGIQRASGLYVNPNHLAGLLEVLGIFALSITCWSRWPSWSRVLIGYLAAMCYIGVAMTGSRGGYLSVAASFILFALLSLIVLRSAATTFLLKFGAGALIALAAAFIAAGLLIQQNAPVSERLGNIVTTDNTRLDLWRASIEQWKLQPLTGTGSGTYRFYGRQFRAERMQNDPVYVHNDYLHLLCEYGLVGFAGFLLFISAHLRHGWRSFVRLGPKRLAAGSSPLGDRLALNIGALCAIAAYIVHSVVDFNLHIPANALLLAFVFGVVANPGLKASSEIAQPGQNLVPRLATVVLAAILLLQSARLFPGEYYAERAIAR
jgi:O-antigen ligase